MPAHPPPSREGGHRHGETTNAERDKCLKTLHVIGHPLEVLAEETREERKREKDRRDDREPIHRSVESVGFSYRVELHQAREPLAVRVDSQLAAEGGP